MIALYLLRQNVCVILQFRYKDVSKIIRALDIKKVHCHDNISARMIKICGSSILEPLPIIFRNSLNSGIFPDNRKRSNIVPGHQKGNKQLMQNCHPVSLLSISSKTIERLIFNLLYKCFEENSFLRFNQSGFRKTDSCLNQLLSIADEV